MASNIAEAHEQGNCQGRRSGANWIGTIQKGVVMRILRLLLLILLIGGCAAQVRPKVKTAKVDVLAEYRKAENREIIMRDILQYLNDRAFLRMGLIYMPPEE